MGGPLSDCFARAVRKPIGLALVFCALLTAGCGAQAERYTEPRDIGDKVTAADLESFLQVVDDLPGKKLPELPPLFKGPPSWDEQRTLPVNELLREENDEIEKQWNNENFIRHLAKDRALQKALRQRLSLPQFVGLVKTIGIAMARISVRPDQDLRHIIELGKKRLETLRSQNRRFNELKPDERHMVLATAAWTTRIDRARRLLDVPPENRALARDNYERLTAIFPKEYAANPFDSIADPVEELGISFEERRETGLDAEMDWKESDALRGTDTPGPDLNAATASAPSRSGAP
jgi:hypothetical protein